MSLTRRTRLHSESRSATVETALDLIGNAEVTIIQRYLALDSQAVCNEAQERLQGKRKGFKITSVMNFLSADGDEDVLTVFEGGSDMDRMRVVVTEILEMMQRSCDTVFDGGVGRVREGDRVTSCILETSFLLDELRCIITVAMARCPEVLPSANVAKALLCTELCAPLVQAIVENDPGAFEEILAVLIAACTTGNIDSHAGEGGSATLGGNSAGSKGCNKDETNRASNALMLLGQQSRRHAIKV